MIEYIVLGIVQGVAEWLPISSEGLIVITREIFFSGGSLVSSIEIALFLHLGTFFAALVYFWKDVKNIANNLTSWKSSNPEDKNLIIFLTIATLLSGILGLVLITVIDKANLPIDFAGNTVMILVGIFLLITGFLQLKAKESNLTTKKPNNSDGLLLGVVQGFAALPGLSRSGLTVSALLLRKYSKTDSLKLSFLLSLPIVLGGNILLNLNGFNLNPESLVGLISSFVFGYLSIKTLMGVARRVNFGWFVIIFGLLSIGAGFI